MTARDAIREARRRGIVLTPAGVALRFVGPQGALSEYLKRELKKHKPEIIVLLGERRATYPCSRCDQFAFAEAGTICYWCRQVPHEA